MVKAGKNAQASMEMVEALVGGWFHWINKGQPPDSTGFWADIQEAIKNQASIGWDQVIHGRVTKKRAAIWPPTPPNRFTDSNKTTTSNLWILDTLNVSWKQ